ncbi:MAG: circadian clock protein KaiB [Cyanobacteria bacterium Co-bin8]|nr:circadian clock protein KaiB [Cyanobacteria bacterium Co-bin8]
MTDSPVTSTSPQVFKGIALFTPGGDLVYCLDKQKRTRWHLDLCATLQDQLALSDPPYFLLPSYTATVDRWIDPASGQLVMVAEAYPRVLRFRALLNAVFAVEAQWQPVYTSPETGSPVLLEMHRAQFPQLWECHDLIVQADRGRLEPPSLAMPVMDQSLTNAPTSAEPLAFRLFVSGSAAASAENLLRVLYTTFESVLKQPYTLKLIDVTQHPEQAEADQISVTPTLVRVWPEPRRRIAGDLSSPRRLLAFLQTP